jgi:dimethylamine/trimethylamine dehydrogenase
VDGDGGAFVRHVDHLVDMWDINVGWAEWGEDAGPSRTHAENHEAPWAGKVKELTDKPVVNVGRFVSPDVMVDAIRSGQCDIIGAARPSIADPFLPRKIEEGQLDEIRECIGCNVCISRWEAGGPPIVCTQNATSGEEYRRGWHPERFERALNSDNDVLVVGAGPAGLECAIVLAKRGMRRVHLVEADRDIGGCLRWIPQLPGLGEWARVVNYRRIQLDKLRNVEVITGTRLIPEEVLEYGAEIVVVATGSSWAGDGMNGITLEPVAGADTSLPHVLTPEQVMAGKPVGQRVLVVDADGYFVGAGIAEKLAREGSSVTYLTPFETTAPYLHLTLEAPRVNRILRGLGVDIVTERVPTAIEPGCVRAVDLWTFEEERTWEAESVVLVTQRNSDDELFRALKASSARCADAGIHGLYQIGDCLLPGMIADAIFSGHRLAREIDSPDPATPLPYVRERRLLNASEADFELESDAVAAPLPSRVRAGAAD